MGSKLDPFKDWICEQLEAEPRIQSQRLREMALESIRAGIIKKRGSLKGILDEFLAERRGEAAREARK